MKRTVPPDSFGPLHRWRLVLGQASDRALGDGLDERGQAMDAALQWLYGRGGAGDGRDVQERNGGQGPSQLDVPAWIDQVHTLFPRETIERLERDAVERYQISEVVTNPEVLRRVRPSEALLRAVLRTKHLMNAEVLALARELVRRVVDELMARLRVELRVAFSGARDRRRRSSLKVASNFDFKTTLRRNLKHWDPDTRRIVIQEAFFHSRVRRHTEPWQVILLVDQSGSMVASVIHSAITAACLWSIPGVKPHLVAFDTAVVDLTDDVSDPVELLMKVQLGGGTDIARAMTYGAELVSAPRRAIVVLISDLYEGGSTATLVQEVRDLVAQGSRVLCLTALDADAVPSYDRALGQTLADCGAYVGAMTPGQLAGFVADAVHGR